MSLLNNRLLAAVPSEEYQRIASSFRTVSFRRGEVVYRDGEEFSDVYFPVGGVGSITTVMSNGSLVETATVGHEGMFGIEALFSVRPKAQGDTMLQVPNEGDRATAAAMPVRALRAELAGDGVLSKLLPRYAQTVLAQTMQSVACNALHPVEERCARWLLQTADRMNGQDFHLSHEFLSIMLGVRRPTVTIAAGTLQAAGLIQYKHGKVTILDRAGLEAASCECFSAIRGRYEKLFTNGQ